MISPVKSLDTYARTRESASALFMLPLTTHDKSAQAVKAQKKHNVASEQVLLIVLMVGALTQCAARPFVGRKMRK